MAIHTLELSSPALKKQEYTTIRNYVFKLQESRKLRFIDRTDKPILKAILNDLPGITILLYKDVFRYLRLIVNPAVALGGGYEELTIFTKDLLRDLSFEVDSLLTIIGAWFTFDDLSLGRIDCTHDVTMPDGTSITELISCLKRTALPRGYEQDTFPRSAKNWNEKNTHSFRIHCDDICLTVYDKSFQLNNEQLMAPEYIPPNRLRLEASFGNRAFQRIENKYMEDVEFGKDKLRTQILTFSNLSVRLLNDYFGNTVLPGRYLRMDLAIKEIEDSHFTPRTKKKMITLLREVRANHRYGVEGAILSCNMKSDEAARYLAKFRELDLNPATLPITSKHNQVSAITRLLDDLSA